MPESCSLGWHPDLPDFRDYTPWNEKVETLLRRLPPLGTQPSHVDWRDRCTPCREAGAVQERGGPVDICVDLLEQCEHRTQGRQVALSRPFVARTAHRLALTKAVPPMSLRAVWKAIVRFGVPDLDEWPGSEDCWNAEPDAFAYGIARDYSELRYIRLDPRGQSGPDTLERVRTFLAAGFMCVFGIPLCTSAGQDGEIGYPTIFDDVRGGRALMAVGYDDRRRVRSDRGCLAVRSGWGCSWGEDGYGWLPYAYVRERLAVDFWTILEPTWLGAGEFKLPE